MMINFSWKKINNTFGWNAYNVLVYFYLKQGVELPPFLQIKNAKKLESIVRQPYPQGNCYLLNINNALLNAKDLNYLYIYLELASKRNLFDYKMRGITYLPIHFVPEYLHRIIHINSMLEVRNDEVHFKYEQR